MTEQTPNIDISAALSGNYLLADVSLRRFSGFKKDNAASEAVTVNAHATANSAKVIKDLLSGARNELKDVVSAQDAIRAYLYNNTLPWSANTDGRKMGARLLPAVKSIDFLKHYKTLRTVYEHALADFLSVYDLRRQEAMRNLGSLADPNDYPTRDEITTQFGVDLNVQPVPAATDFSRVAIPAQVAEALGARAAGIYKQSLDNAMQDLSDRLLAELKRMAVQLGKFGAGEKTKLYSSLIDNMRALVELVKATNYANDTKINELVDRLAELTQHDIKTLRANATVASDIAAKAVELSNDIEADLYF
jgi:hypothetical protein